VLEGPDLILAALDASIEFEAIYVDGPSIEDENLASVLSAASDQGVRIFSLARGVLEKVADTQTPQPVLAVVRLPVAELGDVVTNGVVMVLHDLRDPGNAGTIVRSADAAGADAVIFTGSSVDPFNPKTLRATAGSIFHLPVVVASLDDTFDFLARGSVCTIATVVQGGRNFRDVDYAAPAAIFIGNEATGLDDATIARCEQRASIPMRGKSESLNAAIAASLIVFEALRQREDTIVTPRPRSLEES
jgi:TrmH family RNA methyltransferase